MRYSYGCVILFISFFDCIFLPIGFFNMFKSSCFLTVLICLGTLPFTFKPSPAFSAGRELEKLLDLDIEDLVFVTVASKRAEAIEAAPGIITLVSRQDIDSYGGVNLLDVLNRVPNLQVIGSTNVPNHTLSIRAATNQHYTNRILFLINGRPVRDKGGAPLNAEFFTGFPVSMIEQIEVIRGPGSVLHGTNAFAGVVNITTREGVEDGVVELSSTYGSFNRRQHEGRTGFGGENWSLNAAFKTMESDGDNFSLIDENGTSGTYAESMDGNSLFLKGHYGRLDFEAFRAYTKQDHFSFFGTFGDSLIENTKRFVDIGYTQPLWGSWEAKANITYNGLRSGFWTSSLTDSYEDLANGEMLVQGKPADQLNLLFGGAFEHFDGQIANGVQYQSHRHSFYTQADWQALDWLKLTGGLQVNDSETFKVNYSPRAGAVIALNDRWSSKILYGEAFRSPVAVETEINIPGVLVSNDSTKPETIKTLEGQISYHDNNFSGSLTAYRNRIQDIIGRTASGTPGLTLITNTGEQVFEGVEFEGSYDFANGLSIQGSAAYQVGESDSDIDDPTFFPNANAKLGVSYARDFWSVGVFNSWFGTPEDVRSTNPSVDEVNPQPESYHLLSFNADMDVNEALDLPPALPQINLTLYGENLLDEDIYFPEYNRRNINSFQIETGRALFGRLSVKF